MRKRWFVDATIVSDSYLLTSSLIQHIYITKNVDITFNPKDSLFNDFLTLNIFFIGNLNKL